MNITIWLHFLHIILFYIINFVFAEFVAKFGKDSPDARKIDYMPGIPIHGLEVIHLTVPPCKKLSYIRVNVHKLDRTPIVTYKQNTQDITIDVGSSTKVAEAYITVKGQKIPKCNPESAHYHTSKKPINIFDYSIEETTPDSADTQIKEKLKYFYKLPRPHEYEFNEEYLIDYYGY